MNDTAFKNQTYVMGFTGYSGNYSFATANNKYDISKPKSNSLESWLHKKNSNDYFVDFKTFKKINESFFMNGFNWKDYKLDWQNYFDGIIYLESMESCIKNNDIK